MAYILLDVATRAKSIVFKENGNTFRGDKKWKHVQGRHKKKLKNRQGKTKRIYVKIAFFFNKGLH